jgi:phenylacetate-CoA ligase
VIVPRAISAAWHLKSEHRVRARVRSLYGFSRATAEERRRLYGRALMAILQRVGRRADALPEWAEAARVHDPDEVLRLWPELPILTKTQLRERFPAVEMANRFALRGRLNASGGSTGEPIHFFHDQAMLESATARMYYFRRRLGWVPGMPCVSLWGSDRDVGKSVSQRRRLAFALRRELVIAGFEVDHRTAERFVTLVGHHAPVAVFGYTSLLVEVARLALENGLRVAPGSIRAAWNGAEPLAREQSELFRKAFGVPICDQYGGRELSAIACQFEAGGPIEILGPDLLAEIVDDEGKPAAPGVPGRLILTSTICGGTPFLRYEIGDLAVADAEHRDAGGLRALASLCGRLSGILQLPDGRRLHNGFWNHLFKDFPDVHQFQVVVRRTELVIRLKGPGFRSGAEDELRGRLYRLGMGISPRLEWTAHIPLTRAGKLLQVVDERAPDHGTDHAIG